MDQYKEKLNLNPRSKAGIVSKLTFWWLLPMLWTGYKRDLKTDDLYEVEPCDESKRLAEKMEKYWREEQERAKSKGGRASYARALWRCFGCRYLAVGLLAAIEECILRIAQPLFLGYLIRYTNGEFGSDRPWLGWLFATGIVMGSLVYIFTHHPFFWGIQHIGMQIRIASCSLLFRKAVRLSKAAMGQTTVGQMVNLLSNDVNRFDTSVIFLNYLWIGPLQLLIVTVLLWDMLGPQCLAGIVVLVLYIPLQSWMGKVFSRLRLVTAIRTDERVRVMNEIVTAMRVIKMYAWEAPFTKLVEEARKKEIDVVMHTNYYRAINMSLFFTSAKLVVFLALLTYVLTGNLLTAEKVFVTSALINNVRLAMTLFFPFGVAMGSETLISCRRLQEFFELEEVEQSNRVHHEEQRPPLEKCGVDITKISAKWNEEQVNHTLHDITVKVKAGQLLAVIGPVGAGKGSLLHAILAELPLLDGCIAVRGRVAYAPQEAWVFSGSVKQNIIFGQPFKEKKYCEVIKVCGLESDLAQLPYGDRTMVGERGTALSGGQKARINLARAVYYDGDIILLDDPLSAVDSVVGRHLYLRCIRQHLRHKAVILVTHQLQYLQSADNILVLKEGRCDAFGNYHQLVNSGVDFTSLLQEMKEKDANNLPPPSAPQSITGPGIKNNLRRGSSFTGSLRSRRGSIRQLSDSNPLLASSAISLTDSIVSLDCVEAMVQDDDACCSSHSSQSIDDSALRNWDDITESVMDTSPPRKQSVREASKGGTDVGTELRSAGSVSNRVYVKYFLNGGHWILCIVLALANIITQILFSATDYWLSHWTNGEQLRGYNGTHGSTYGYDNVTANVSDAMPTVPPVYLDITTNVIIYSSLVGGLFLFSLGRTVLFFVMCMTSSRQLHNKMFASVIRVPIRYFDTHPIGQILNRFTKDMGQIDELLPATLFDYITIMLNFLGIIAVIASLNYWLLLPTFLLALIFVALRRFYLATARDIKRLEGITRSPVFSHLSASLQGITTIRAFKAEEAFITDFDTHQDIHSASWFLFLCTTRWFGICLDWISCLYIAIVTYSFLGMDSALGGDVGLAISSAMMLSGMFQWGVRQSAEVENQMTSVERVIEFSKLKPEPPLTTNEDSKLDPKWPRTGSLKFINVNLQYADDEPLVLKGLNFDITSGEKIGIVGRTGAGKSSLISCLFRLTEVKGVIQIDGVEVGSLGLHKLRKNISIIPQDPTLFNGTFRKNLDPFSEHADDKLWHALEEVQLKDAVQESIGGLEYVISEGGSNLSVGQRQLVCLARAILSNNTILLMDEATANVDPKTDELIQQTIREKFVTCTVLTVAHRLHTIMDSTRVMVMSKGELKEFDAPHLLLQRPNSLFSELVAQTGTGTAGHLRSLARTAYASRHKRNEVLETKKEESDESDTSTSLLGSHDESTNSDEFVIPGQKTFKEYTKTNSKGQLNCVEPSTSKNVSVESGDVKQKDKANDIVPVYSESATANQDETVNESEIPETDFSTDKWQSIERTKL